MTVKFSITLSVHQIEVNEMYIMKKYFIILMLLSLISGCAKPASKLESESASQDESMTESTPNESITEPILDNKTIHTPQGEFTVKLSPDDKTIVDFATEIYSYEQLEEISKFKGTIQELNERYPMYCIRQNRFTGVLSPKVLHEKYPDHYSGDTSILPNYTVSYLGEDDYIAILIFDRVTGELLYSDIYHASKTKNDFEKKVGASMELVQRMDPDGEFPFLYTSGIQLPPISYHYTTDGYCVGIEYDDNGLVANLDYYLI